MINCRKPNLAYAMLLRNLMVAGEVGGDSMEGRSIVSNIIHDMAIFSKTFMWRSEVLRPHTKNLIDICRMFFEPALFLCRKA